MRSRASITALPLLLASLLVLVTTPVGASGSAEVGSAAHRTWYVSAGSPSGGDGSRTQPFDTLHEVEEASSPGDTIVVLPAPLSVPPLDGGIALKVGQRLIGGGPPVLLPSHPAAGPPDAPPVPVSSGLSSLPRLTNSSGTTNHGDAIELADDSEVANLVIDGSYRGAIYGLDVTGVSVHDNDISGQNASGTNGFLVQPFVLETYTPFLGLNATAGVQCGWAGIMIDETVVTGEASIDSNYVHDGACGNGIDVRTMKTANVTVTIDGNFITRLRQCSVQRAVQGISTQAIGTSALRAELYGNTETDNGNPGANSDSLFVNPAESGRLVEVIDHNSFVNGVGGASTNGFEFILSNGDASGDVQILNSTFVNDAGDMLEEFNYGASSRMTLALDNVVARTTTISGGTPSYADPSGTATITGNLGECLGISQDGAGDTTTFRMSHSEFSGCGNDGIQVTNNLSTSPPNGIGVPVAIDVDIDNSRVTGSRYYNLWINNLTPLGSLKVRAEDSDLSSAGGVAVAFDQQPTGTTGAASIDLGGGALGSHGGNCIFGGEIYGLETTGYDVAAENDWWGAPGGPASGITSTTGPGSLTTAPALTRPPHICGERP